MRVLLVQPPRRDARDPSLAVPPLGLCHVAASLRQAGHDVAILDARAEGVGWDRLGDRFAHARADAIGVTAQSPIRDLAARACALARPHARWLLLGGPHPSAVGAAVFGEIPGLDLAVEGEGEQSAPAALAWLASGAAADPPAGVRAPGRPFRPRLPPEHLDDLPPPARDLLPRHGYHHLLATDRAWATLVGSRGCPHACTFCDHSVAGRRWRARSAASLVAELTALRAAGVRHVHFYDDGFCHDRDRVLEICARLRALDLGLTWNCEARVDSVDAGLLRAMAGAGCQLVAFGVESASDATLDRLGKGFCIADTERAFAGARAAGLRTLAYVILGSPGEGLADALRTLTFVRRLGADFVQFSSLAALPGAPLSAVSRPLAEVRGVLDADLCREVLTDLEPAALRRLLGRGWAGFYLRPAPLARLARAALRSGAWREAPRLALAAGLWALEVRR
jgi:radical SAM superfamily enzyme YgiQ (UPF0313 family)